MALSTPPHAPIQITSNQIDYISHQRITCPRVKHSTCELHCYYPYTYVTWNIHELVKASNLWWSELKQWSATSPILYCHWECEWISHLLMYIWLVQEYYEYTYFCALVSFACPPGVILLMHGAFRSAKVCMSTHISTHKLLRKIKVAIRSQHADCPSIMAPCKWSSVLPVVVHDIQCFLGGQASLCREK